MVALKTINGMTEKEIISGCIKRDHKAQHVLYHTYCKKMLAICARYVQNDMEAEDIVQEAFVKVFRNIEKFRNEGSFEGWLRRIFVNTAIEHYRRSAPMYSLLEIDNSQYDMIDENAISHLNKEALLQMIQSLSPGYRTVFNLYAIEGYTHKEIGSLLNISEGTSKSQLARARSILQKKLELSSKTKITLYEAII